MRLRERKKEESRRRIVEAAARVFARDGYLAARIADIAALAEVGAGTIYNYYRSKGELLIAVFAGEWEAYSAEIGGIAESAGMAGIAERAGIGESAGNDERSGKDERTGNDEKCGVSLADAVTRVYEQGIRAMLRYPKSFLREIFAVSAGNFDESEQVRSSFVRLDEQFMGSVGELLEAAKENGQCAKDFDTGQAVMAVYSVFAVQFLVYCYSDSLELESHLSAVRLQVEFVLAGIRS